MSDAWRRKAHREIAAMCRASYLQANTKEDGTLYKKRRPYAVPELARELVACLGDQDLKAAELRAKQIFMYKLQTAKD